MLGIGEGRPQHVTYHPLPPSTYIHGFSYTLEASNSGNLDLTNTPVPPFAPPTTPSRGAFSARGLCLLAAYIPNRRAVSETFDFRFV